MPKQIGRHSFSGPKPTLDRIPKEPGIFVVQARTGTFERLLKVEAAEDMNAAVAAYAKNRSKLSGDDFFKRQQIYTLPLFSVKAGSSLTTEVRQFYKEQQEAK